MSVLAGWVVKRENFSDLLTTSETNVWPELGVRRKATLKYLSP